MIDRSLVHFNRCLVPYWVPLFPACGYALLSSPGPSVSCPPQPAGPGYRMWAGLPEREHGGHGRAGAWNCEARLCGCPEPTQETRSALGSACSPFCLHLMLFLPPPLLLLLTKTSILKMWSPGYSFFWFRERNSWLFCRFSSRQITLPVRNKEIIWI